MHLAWLGRLGTLPTDYRDCSIVVALCFYKAFFAHNSIMKVKLKIVEHVILIFLDALSAGF